MKHEHHFWPVHYIWNIGEPQTRQRLGHALFPDEKPTFYQCDCGEQGFPL